MFPFLNFEKSIGNKSNIARESKINIKEIIILKTGEEFITPNLVPVIIITIPSTPYAPAIPRPYRNPRKKPSLREEALAPAPITVRVIGIIGKTQGVRLRARPPIKIKIIIKKTLLSAKLIPRPAELPPMDSFKNSKNSFLFLYPVSTP